MSDWIVPLVAIFGLPALIALFGGFHGQRCAKAYEKPLAAWERCVIRVSEGGPVWDENTGFVWQAPDQQ